MKKNLLILALFFCNYFSFGQAFTWMQKAPIPGIPSGIYSGCSFTINNLIYVAGGCTSGLDSNYQNLWEYDPATDVWTQRADMPLAGTYGSSAFVINNIGYVAGGWHRTGAGTMTSFSYSYKYDPTVNTWDSIAVFPSVRYTSVAFELNGKGYMGTGYAPLTNDWWQYDPVTDSWSQKANFPGNVRQASHGFSVGGYGYLCMGGQYQVNYSDMYQYDDNTNTWTQKANYPDTARSSGSTFVLNNKAYLMGGSNWMGDPFASIYCYDPALDQWTFVCYFPGGKRHAMITAVANNKVYMGQGSYTDQNAGTYLTANDWWECSLADANVISGKAYLDFNNNNTQDSGEAVLANKFVREANTGRFTFTRLNGTYDLSVLDSGNYTVYMDSMGYFGAVPPSYNVNFSGINETDSLNDFSFQSATSINDLCTSLSPLGAFRPGFDASYSVSYDNSGTTVLPGTIIFFPDSQLTYVSSSLTPISITSDSIVWDLGSINPFQSGNFTITFNVSVIASIGDTVTSHVVIEPVAGDANPSCNYASWDVAVTGSFDPNDILVNRETVGVNELTAPPYLDYIIDFQNTGNDTAFNIDIVNTLPMELEINSFELVSSSFPVVIRYIDGYNSMGFKFNNIFLPDSNVNEPLSHGFVHYQIKPLSTLTVGTTIENHAAIYFDFNAPVLTNTAITQIISPVGIPVIKNYSGITLSPSPNNGNFYVGFKSALAGETAIAVYDALGKSVYNEMYDTKNGLNKFLVKSSANENGIYFITVKTPDKNFTEKFVISGF